jgi:hypothetical protein
LVKIFGETAFAWLDLAREKDDDGPDTETNLA